MANLANESGRSRVSWGAISIWVLIGSLIGAGAMVLTDMPEGNRSDLLVFVLVSSVSIGAGAVVTGARDSSEQSNRNLIGLISGGVLGVAVVVSVNVVLASGANPTEAIGDAYFGTVALGGFLVAGGALLGYLGSRFGRRLADSPRDGHGKR